HAILCVNQHSSSICEDHSFSFYTSFSFNHTAAPELYTLSLHDALPISVPKKYWDLYDEDKLPLPTVATRPEGAPPYAVKYGTEIDRKSTRLNSSHVKISYAVFCLKKKNEPDI